MPLLNPTRQGTLPNERNAFSYLLLATRPYRGLSVAPMHTSSRVPQSYQYLPFAQRGFLAGNSVIVKPPEQASLSTLRFAELI